ncbi:MAG: hypothetical protein HUU55_14740 [Myxococcales bacterium]|nr:hypothetical protein [Myxococcales bacterium]
MKGGELLRAGEKSKFFFYAIMGLWICLAIGISVDLSAQEPDTAKEKSMKAEYATPPFSAGVIRDATGVGQTYVFRLSGGGQPPILRKTVFLEVTAVDTKIQTVLTDTDGKPFDGPKEWRFTWEQLEEHAHFPAQQTERTEKKVTVPTGTYDCWHFVVIETVDGKKKVSEYAFAKHLPGPPIWMSVTIDGELQTNMELIQYIAGEKATDKSNPKPTLKLVP